MANIAKIKIDGVNYTIKDEALTTEVATFKSTTQQALNDLSTAIGGINSEFVTLLQKVVAELDGEDPENPEAAWVTLIDKLKGLKIDGEDVDVKDYVDTSIQSLSNSLEGKFLNVEYNDNTVEFIKI